MMKRKHRVVVEITAEEPITEKRAVELVDRALDSSISDSWCAEVTSYLPKGARRVIAAAERRAVSRWLWPETG